MTEPTFFGDNWPTTEETIKKPQGIIPGSSGGPIEAVKRAVITALRDAITGTTLNYLVSGSEVSVDMEYPMVETQYPGIWVQFSFTDLSRAGLGHEVIDKVVENAGTDEEWVNWQTIREFQFQGRISLTVVALTSLERDRLADAIVTMLMFSRPPESVITRADKDTHQFRQLLGSLATNPYIFMSVNNDTIVAGGQTATTSVPWDEEIMGYEDTYSFDILGQTNIVFRSDGTYTLHAVNLDAEPITRFDWQ